MKGRRETDTKGIFIRGENYWIRYFFEGTDGIPRYYRNKIGPINDVSKHEAIRRLIIIDDEIKKGIHVPKVRETIKVALERIGPQWKRVVSETEPRTKTVREVIDKYLSLSSKDLKNKTCYSKFWKNTALVEKDIDQVKTSDLQALQKSLIEEIDKKKKKKSGTIDHLFIFLRSCMIFAVKNDYIQKNPFQDFEFIREPSPPIQVFSNDQLKQLKKHMTPENFSIIELLLFTGARRGELLTAEWRYSDLKNRVLMIPHSKSGKNRSVLLSKKAVDIIKNLPSKGKSQWLFPSESQDTDTPINADNFYKRIFKKACKDAKLEGLTLQGLRHSYVTRLLESQTDLESVRKLAGHSDFRMLLKYAHVSEEHLKKVVNKI